MFSIFGQSLYTQFFSWLISTAIVAIPVFFALFKFFGKKWLENRFLKDLEAFKAQTLHEFSFLLMQKTKFLDKSYDVFSDLWIQLKNAQNTLKLMSILREHPDFNRMDESDFKTYLDRNDFTDHEKEYFLKAEGNNRNKSYSEIMDYRGLISAHKAFLDFHLFFEKNRIFLDPDLRKKFLEIDDYIWDAWVSRKMSLRKLSLEGYLGDDRLDFLEKALNIESEKIKPLIDEIENLLQEKLFPNNESKKLC